MLLLSNRQTVLLILAKEIRDTRVGFAVVLGLLGLAVLLWLSVVLTLAMLGLLRLRIPRMRAEGGGATI